MDDQAEIIAALKGLTAAVERERIDRRDWKIPLRNGLISGLGAFLGATLLAAILVAMLRPLLEPFNLARYLERTERVEGKAQAPATR